MNKLCAPALLKTAPLLTSKVITGGNNLQNDLRTVVIKESTRSAPGKEDNGSFGNQAGGQHAVHDVFCSGLHPKTSSPGTSAQLTGMDFMFNLAGSSSAHISSRNASYVIDMGGMFVQAGVLDQDIVERVTSQVSKTGSMFLFADEFNHGLLGWCVNQTGPPPESFDSGAITWALLDSRRDWGAPCAR
eukprot:scaffold86_cov338-Pavlova_lutheri.AAC.3